MLAAALDCINTGPEAALPGMENTAPASDTELDRAQKEWRTGGLQRGQADFTTVAEAQLFCIRDIRC